MQTIPWNDDMSLGIKLIDDIHKKLIDTANELISAVSRGRKPRTLTHCLVRLREQAVEHIKTEETIMASRRYARRSLHSLENKKFMVAMRRLHRRLKNAEGLTDREMESFAASIIYHIKSSNQAIVGSLATK